MSGPLDTSSWMYNAGGKFYPYEIEQSLRFNDDDSAHLGRTFSTAGNRKRWTWSAWVKRGNLGGQRMLYSSNLTPGSTEEQINLGFPLANGVAYRDGASGNFTVPVGELRDPSAWYHIVFAYDSANATQADRGIFYINGVRQATTTDAIPLNRDSFINDARTHAIGRFSTIASAYYDGLMAEVNFVDGLALDASAFGEFKSGVWIPKQYTGAYGTNGYYLTFSDSAAIGDDLSGNGNDWGTGGIVATDVLLDSPTNNWATWNPLGDSGITLSDGNLQASSPTAAYRGAFGTLALPTSGKWYFEAKLTANSSGSNIANFGVAPTSTPLLGNQANATNSAGFYMNANVLFNVGPPSVTIRASAGLTSDVFQVCYDADTRNVYLGLNNTFYDSTGAATGDPAAGTNPSRTLAAGDFAPWIFAYQIGWISNFGQSPFAYTPPAGFLALNTANLPEPTITPARDDVPADYFNTVLYTGTGAAQSITGVGFQPDWVWFKRRSATENHWLTDVVRGTDKGLFSNAATAETTRTDQLTSFDADGFSLGADAAGYTNVSGQTYVAWNWKAAGAGVANTDGTISSTVSANQKAGFSIVSYTGTGATGTIGHGLGVAPRMVIVKDRTSGTRTVSQWPVYHASVGPTKAAFLNVTDTPFTESTYYNNTAPDASVFTVGSWGGINFSGDAFIAYCFAEVEGYSKFGSYTGNGSADGPFVWCGFRPAFVMVKRTDSTGNWLIKDTARDPANEMGRTLLPDVSDAEYGPANTPFDFLSNGFKLRTTSAIANASGGTYIFMAMAFNPFKYSNAR